MTRRWVWWCRVTYVYYSCWFSLDESISLTRRMWRWWNNGRVVKLDFLTKENYIVIEQTKNCNIITW